MATLLLICNWSCVVVPVKLCDVVTPGQHQRRKGIRGFFHRNPIISVTCMTCALVATGEVYSVVHKLEGSSK